MYILGIETSCDETAASIIEIKNGKIKVLSNIVSSQIKIHQQYGGVVPEVAARNHIKNIMSVIEKVLSKSSPSLLRRGLEGGIDFIAVTQGPGLICALLVGTETAKTLAYVWNKPIIGVNHLAGHIYSNWVNADKPPRFPALALIVSGGHTELILMAGHFRFKMLGQTRDDAVGEAFDKVAKILGLGYPGGPIVSKYAKEGNSEAIKMPRPMINDNNLEFSFSGLKTSVFYQIQKDSDWEGKIPDYCASFQQAVIDVLIAKTLKAAKQYKVKSVMLSGGVAANQELRQQLGEAVKLGFKTQLDAPSYHIPDLKYTTDNAAMIAAAGYFLQRYKKSALQKKIKVDCNLGL
ncbi:tRNA (adenosine(37)-N6)-threonylcarbamoyltransferase complex transferase subunit TsaD [Candidatus Falkowbacteria bacterium CG10_big_fil_rev_8_21_14_0_10_43_10]|uniref:tRNA N6-adenosine threonylcarbamoyltransferase n=1 Tax=Candidatus Falkowbacteria bacterium CG10_big_fil_rev_8_21_14_0_10_43_10 TaxID=1974567 RepID=A0A2H0V237_9BACT|nr:MAG: tRNA (adenosine(37)-N6)-threonylcarbamoyltransferase complex transferase subunit TsaD [Candidatus Falkowbacteria bacterium CG10_big_fil_rev_8_21_14_0_10_43_10]